MRNRRSAWYYFALVGVLIFLFFTNDFGLIDIQKTAIVTAVGIDRDENGFLLTSQIAVPQASKQGEQVQSVEIESKGKTIADAFEEVNAKTGWYPKLVFCDLIVLGKTAVEKNVFEALDYFLRNEYVSDGCYVCVYEGKAKDAVSAKTPIEKISALAVEKILSPHAARVGSVFPVTLKEFALDYFSAGEGGVLPILKMQKPNGEGEQGAGGANGSSGSSGSESGGSPSGQDPAQGGQGQNEQIFSAEETALFLEGIMVGKLDKQETFALCSARENLKLASYAVESAGSNYTLTFKKNRPKIKFYVDKNAAARLEILLDVTAGVQDVSTPNTVTEIATPSNVPDGLFREAERRLESEIRQVFEKSAAVGSDVFGLYERLRKFERNYLSAFKDDLLSRVILSVKVKIKNAR